MAATGLATIGIKFEYKNGSTFTELDGLMEVPEMGGKPNKIDVTTLKDTVKKSVNGVKDLGDQEFLFLYDNSSTTSNFRVLKGLEASNAKTTFKITYPDTTSHQFDAQVSVSVDSAKVDDKLTFKLSCALQSDITITNPTTP